MDLDHGNLLLELAEKIEKSQKALFQLDNVLAALSRRIEDEFGFEYVATQLFNKEDRTIQTVHATRNQQSLIGLAKHPIDGDDEILDIQASVFNADPPMIKLISGWDSHFDKLIYEQFNHALLVRAWVPIIIINHSSGGVISDWPDMRPWRYVTERDTHAEKIDGQLFTRFNISILLDKTLIEETYGKVFIQKLGTVEVGHRLLEHEITPEMAVSVSDVIATHVISGHSPNGSLPSLRETSLDYVLETTAKSAMRMLGGKIATLHFRYDPHQNGYVYQTASGIGPEFIARHPPRKDGLGRQAIRENRPLVAPDVAAGQSVTYLETANPPAWELGLRTIAAFPLIVGDSDGVLYIGFEQPRCLTTYETNVIERFLGRASQAILSATYYKRTLDENRRLTNLNSIAQLLVTRHPDPYLLYKIAGYALNVLAADGVTFHEYMSAKETFVDVAYAGHWHEANVYDAISQHVSAKQIIHNNPPGIVYEDLYEHTGDLPDDVKRFILSEGFKCRFSVLLRYTGEIFGVMFIYYRRPYELSSDDERAIEILAAHAVIAMRVRRSWHETFAQIGHDFNRHISKLAARVALLRDSINKTPYVSVFFWNSEMGDLLKDVVNAKDDITRFAREFQEFGKVICLKRRPVDMGKFIAKQVRQAQREVDSVAPFGELRICISYNRPEDECIAAIDESYMGRAIDLVLHNAVQALWENDVSDPRHIVVEVRSEADVVSRWFCVISISDNGPGVLDRRKEEIFRLFYTTRDKVGGNGIGLASARRYTELHGGTLREVGKSGEGARFVFTLPLHTGKIG